MKTRLATILIAHVVLHVQAADPAKPRMGPRPIPGMPKASVKAASQPSPPVPSAAMVAAMAATAGPATDTARIVKIYRRGTLAAPKVVPAVAAPLNPTTQSAPAAPLPGQVRILTKTQADLLAAQPSP